MFRRSADRGLFDLRRHPGFSTSTSSRWSLLAPRACLHQGSANPQSQCRETTNNIPFQSPSSFFSLPLHAPAPRTRQHSSIGSGTDNTAGTRTTASGATPVGNRNDEGQAPHNQIPREKLPLKPIFQKPLTLATSLVKMLPHLTTQTPHYISAHLHARPYLLTAGDNLRLPFLMPNVKPGDILRFNRASVIGSRDFTLKGAPYIDERMFECRVRVLGVDAEPLRIKEKTKRRQRHVRHVKSKHRYTLMRVMDVKVKSVEELLEEGAQVVEEGSADSPSTLITKA